MEDRNLSISITVGTVIKAVIVLVLAWLLFVLRDLFLLVLTAIVIASAIEPAVHGLTRRRIPRALAVLIVYIILFAVFFGIFYFFVPLLLSDFLAFVSSFPTYIAAIGQSPVFGDYAQTFGITLPASLSSAQLVAAMQHGLDLGSTVGSAFGVATAIFGGVFSFVIIIVFSIYFAVIETGVDDFLRIVTPRSHQAYIQGLWRRSQRKIGLWMQGQLLLAVIMGTIIFLLLTVFGVPHALVLAFLAAVFEIIPVFGPILAAIPAVLLAFAAGGVELGVVTIFIYLMAQQFESHLIYPGVVTWVIGVPPLLVILALIVGWELAGILGIILSVPVAATLQELVRDLENGRLREHAK